MANTGGGGAKFVSVNLNKSYGQPSHNNHSPYNGSYGQAAASRARPGSGGGGGGMVVLSRPRSMQKAGPKLSVPPPLNLPSLRKEHEKFDLSGSGGGPTGGAASGSRPTSSGLGWTKPVTVAVQDKDGGGDLFVRSGGDVPAVDSVNQSEQAVDGVSRSSSVYMPPSARSSGIGLTGSDSVQAYQQPSERATVLRREDFPSLKAALPISGPSQKQKENLHPKQNNVEELYNEQRDNNNSSSLLHMHPAGDSSRHSDGDGLNKYAGKRHGLGSSWMAAQAQKQEYFPGPLPLVRFNPRSDWADDERDTGHGFSDWGRDLGFPKSVDYWEKDFVMPRSSVLPSKLTQNAFERWGQHADVTGKGSSSNVLKVDPQCRDIGTPVRGGSESNSWRASSMPKDASNTLEVVNDRNGIGARPIGLTLDIGRDSKRAPTPFGKHVGDSSFSGNRDSTFVRKDMAHVPEGRQQWNHKVESFRSHGVERNGRDRHGIEQSSRYHTEAFQSNRGSNFSYSAGNKGLPVNGLLSFVGEKLEFSRTERPFREDPFQKDFGSMSFDERDPFTGGLVGVIKRKKDVVKQADLRDPVRESFEAELERVQKMQEMERQRIIEEQERALELARREEEERQRLIREEEERQRRLEEEAQEAAWRAEQERLEGIRMAEEQRTAREEERRTIFLEEERRKQAAKQKLLELEARIAKRQAEVVRCEGSAVITDGKLLPETKEKDVPHTADPDSWEDSERMVERITTSESSDSSVLNRRVEASYRLQPTKEGSSGFMNRDKPINSWRRDAFDHGNRFSLMLKEQDNGNYGVGGDAFVGGRPFPKKDFHGGTGYLSRNYFKGVAQEHLVDEFSQFREQRWNPSGDGDPCIKNNDIDSEFQENLAERYGGGWWQAHSHGNLRSSYSQKPHSTSEADELYSYGRSRYSMRQPRVLPPPSLSIMHKTSFRDEGEHAGSLTFRDNDMHYSRVAASESTMQTGYFGSRPENLEPSETEDAHKEDSIGEDKKLEKDTTSRCDSQSSLSVSSPPNSPTHLSHDELDENEDSPVIAAVNEGKILFLPGDESAVLDETSVKDSMMNASVAVSVGEDEEWTLEHNEELPEQEEYDEDEDGYQEEDEVRDGDDENIDLTQEFEDMNLEEKESAHMMDNLVLGFDDGVEVRMPTDDFERTSRKEDLTFGISEVSNSMVEEQASFDGGDGQDLHPVNRSPDRTQETIRLMNDSIIQPITALQTSSVSDPSSNIDCGSGASAQHIFSSATDMLAHSSTAHSNIPAVSSLPSNADVPVKLQFGLFSGPSLIPSPVPAIQIGSIKMPLHLHSSLGPSLTHIHPSQPPLFQFGQLRYTSPISQGILPMAPQSLSFVQPNVQTHYNLNQSSIGSLPVQSVQDDSGRSVSKDDVTCLSMNNKPGHICRVLNKEDVSRASAQFSVSTESNALISKSQREIPATDDRKPMTEKCPEAEDGKHSVVVKNRIPSSKEKDSEVQFQTTTSSQSHSSERNYIGMKYQGPVPSSRGKNFSRSARNSGLRSSYSGSDASRDSSGFQRRPRRSLHKTEFRIRENIETVSSNNLGMDDKSNFNGKGVAVFTTGSKRGTLSNKLFRQTIESESSNSVPVGSQEIGSGNRVGKMISREASTMTTRRLSHPGEGNLKRNISQEDVDAPLQSGIVRVFKQPGIETPSDEDDFIEVRSKRQMLNDRREQREKENKAKSRAIKFPRKSRSSTQSTMMSISSKKISTSSHRDAPETAKNMCSGPAVPEGQNLVNQDISTGLPAIVSPILAPIGTPASNPDNQADTRSHAIKSYQMNSVSAVSGGEEGIESDIIFETKKTVLDSVQTSLGSWESARINQQVMALTQTQLDEAMKPLRFDNHVASVGGHTSTVNEPALPSSSSSILTRDKSFCSSASPINSLLAGEKIQFGAVTSPTVLPPSSRAVTHGIGAPGSCRPEVQISPNISSAENDCSLFFGKDKHTAEPCGHLEDCEAEAEAAASAVAVAAIGNDEIIGSRLGSAPVTDSKSFVAPDIDAVTGVAGDSQLASQSRAEESLSVSLPADLSVETPPISLWPPLPSPQNSATQILSNFPGGPPSHFPLYEMNPMLRGPIFAFGAHEESAGTQSQTQKSAASGSGPVGAWQQCHSTVDSFYGPPAGFTGPFISPPGGIPGVQGPPHMVVYNHFAPVGQFGQVGLSFMGTTYIPSGKQPDWKHNPASTTMGISEGDMNNMNISSMQRNTPTMTAPIQHLAPGSPLLPMASPFAMFDVPPFQSVPDLSAQPRWSHVPASPLHSVSLSVPLQQEAEGVLPSQFNRGLPVDQSFAANRFAESQTSTPSDNDRSFPMVTDVTVSRFPGELGVVDPSRTTICGLSVQGAVHQSSKGNAIIDTDKSETLKNGSCNISEGQGMNTLKPHQHSQQKILSGPQYNQSSCYNYQRGGVPQKNNTGGDWSHRRMGGFQGRNQSVNAEKSFPHKMKQIYVAKQTTNGTTTAG